MPCNNNEQNKRQTGQCTREAVRTLRIKDLVQARNECFPCSHLPTPCTSGQSVSTRDDRNTTTNCTPCSQRPGNSGTYHLSPRQRQICCGSPCPRQKQIYGPQSQRQRAICIPQNQRQRETYVPQSTQREMNIPCPRHRVITIPQNQRQKEIGSIQIQPRGNISGPQCPGTMIEEIHQCRKTIGALAKVANEAQNIVSEASNLLEQYRAISAQTNQYRVCAGANTNNRNIANRQSRIRITRSNDKVLPRGVYGCASGEAVFPDRSICSCPEKQKKVASKYCCRETKDQSTSYYCPPIVADKCACEKEVKKQEKKKQTNAKKCCPTCPPPVIADECECEEEMKKQNKKKRRNDKNTCCPSIIVDKCECEKYMKKQDKANKEKCKRKQCHTKDESNSLEKTYSMPTGPASKTCKDKCSYPITYHK